MAYEERTISIMKKSKKEYFLLLFIILEFAAVAYDGFFNHSRIIHPIDASYQFQVSDLPLILTTIILAAYVVFLVFNMVFAFIDKEKRRGKTSTFITRKINAKLGWLGFFGFTGFLGIPVFILQNQVWPFFFFVFFGFFGFFYEAKLSNTLMDERFVEEKRRAQLVSYKTGFSLLWLVSWALGITGSHLNTDFVAVAFSVSSSLIIALVLFLNNYLLYKYDTEEEE